MNLPERTSAAQLSCYARCPRKYRLKYLDGAEPEYRSVSLALGSVVHSTVQWWFEQRRDAKEPTIAQAMEVLKADFAAATHDEIRWGNWTPGDLREHAARLVRTFIERFGALEVMDTEMSFDLDLYDPETGEYAPRQLRGYFDFYLGRGRIMELKTARSDYTPARPHHEHAVRRLPARARSPLGRRRDGCDRAGEEPDAPRAASAAPAKRAHRAMVPHRGDSHREGDPRRSLPAGAGLRLCELRVPEALPRRDGAARCRTSRVGRASASSRR
ncbi:MAG: PD-(D/E)XK nuclease family protein [Sandaracinaceae bacterium]|nr:PD-(D/E)XK nuclease family protein [Sandaracinaceae bacterium]